MAACDICNLYGFLRYLKFMWLPAQFAILFHEDTFQSLFAYLGVQLCKVSYNKTKRDAPISQIYFWNRTLHVSESFSVHQQESRTLHTAIGIHHTGYADSLLAISQHNL
jgi:hypothetical protein